MQNNEETIKKDKTNKILRKLGRSGMWAIILVFVILLCSLIASMIQSDFGNIRITTHRFNARDNQVVAYDLYVPNNVDEDNKVPLMLVIPGFQRSRETQGHLALEFARRGYVVINIDPYSQGDSTSSKGTKGSAIATNEGYGAFDLIDYVYDNDEVYPFIDKDKIAVTGHSAGGNAAYQAAVYFGRDAVNNNGVSKVHSIFISGYVLSITSTINFSISNMGMDYALYDEGAFRNAVNTEAPEGYNKADMRYAVESHTFVNSGLEKSGLTTLSLSDEVEIGRIYGNPNLRTMRQVFNTKALHAFQPYDTSANANMIEFFEVALDFRHDHISSSNHVWIYKEVFTSISMLASLILIIPTSILIYRIPFFKSSKLEPVIKKEKRSVGGIIHYLVIFIITAAFAALTYLPSSKLTLIFFPEASNSVNTWFFPQRMNNAVAIWAVISGGFAIMVFLISNYTRYFIKRYKGKANVKHIDLIKPWGISIGMKRVYKTILVALITVLSYFSLLMIVYWVFKVDYRFIFILAARPLNGKVLIQLLMYFPLFFVFYLSNSIRVNGSQMHGGLSEGVKLLLAGFMNIAGLAVILFIQYIVFIQTGTIAFTELADGTTQWLYVNILFTLIPIMFVMPIFNRWFYKISGNAYLGPIIICIIFVIMSLNNSVAYIPI